MTRLLTALAACLATASAGYSGSSYPMSSGEMMNSPPPMMSYEAGSVEVGVTLISTYGGGSSKWSMVGESMKSSGMVHQVTVGGSAGLVYTPDTINAAVGDYVQFNFMSENHTVTQSAFTTPCIKMMGGTDSGFMPNPSNTVNPPPAMKMQVMVSTPLWFYCRQKKPESHCGKGMTFSINPTATKTQAMFQAMAIQQNGTTGMMADTSSSYMMAPPVYTAPPPPPPPSVATPAPYMASGMGSMEGGQCTCQCLCGQDAFPAGAGYNMWGGMSGSIPMGSSPPPPPPPAPAAPPAPAMSGMGGGSY